MAVRNRFHLFSLALIGAGGLAVGQQTTPQSISPAAPQLTPQTTPATTPLTRNAVGPTIHLSVVATAKNGIPVGGLQQEDFKVLDNNTPAPILSFQALSPGKTPVDVLLVIDAVNTDYTNIAFIRSELGKFLTENGGHLANPTSLAVVTDTATQLQEEFSTDGNAINDALEKYALGLRDIRNSAGFYGAEERFQLSLKALNSLVSHMGTQPERKIVIWLSPGWPLLSGPSINLNAKQQEMLFTGVVNLSALLRQTQTTLYSLNPLGTQEGVGRALYYQEFTKGVKKPGQTEAGDLSIQVLAQQSGGTVLNSTGIAKMLDQVSADAQTYYAITFVGQRGDQRDEYHKIQVQIAKPGLTARTLQSYYAQP